MYRSSAVRISPAGNASGSWQLGRNPLSWHRRQSNTRFLFVCLSFSSGANHPLGPPSSPLSTSSSCVSTLRCTVRGTRTFWHRLHSRLNPLRFLQATVWRLAALSFKSREKQMELRRRESRLRPLTARTHLLDFLPVLLRLQTQTPSAPVFWV